MEDSNFDQKKNRKRGRGKIKITKRQHVNNKELVSELIDFKKTIEKEKKKKEKVVSELNYEIDILNKEKDRLENLKKPRKGKLEEIKLKIIKLSKKLEFAEKKPCYGQASDRLGEIFLDLVENYATKSNFSGYTYLEEMKSRAIFFLLRYSPSFKPEKSNNAFSYCTQIVKNAFIQVIKKEKKRTESKKKYVEDYYRNKDFSKKEDDLYFGK